MSICERCGGGLLEGAAFCHLCGAPAGASGASPPWRDETSCAEGPAAAGHASSPPPASLPGPGGGPVGPRPPVTKTSGWAVSSLVLGVLSFMCLPLLGGILAIVFALVARSRIRDSRGEQGGGGFATAGLALGIVNLAVLLALAALAVPWSIHFLGKTRTVTRTLSPQGAERVVAELRMRSGRLSVEGGAEGLFEGTFTFNVRDWEPSVDYSVRGEEGRLAVVQGGDWWASTFWLVRNDWHVRLAGSMPLDLRADLAGAEGVFRLQDLALRSLKVESGSGGMDIDLSGEMPDLGSIEIGQGSGGVRLDLRGTYAPYVRLDVENASGRTEIDLRGRWQGGLWGRVESGSGDVYLYLPQDVGVRVRVRMGSGRLRVQGMTLDSSDRDGAVYVNAAFRESPVTLQLEVECSSGSISLAAGD